MCAKCYEEFIHSPPGTPVPAALLEVDDTGNWVVPLPPVSDEVVDAAVPSATASKAADPQGLLVVFSGCEGDLAEKEKADAGAVSCSSCEGDFAAGARGMSVAGAKPLSWKWRKKLAGWITITISDCDGDVTEETKILLPLDCLPASEMDLLRYCLSWTWRKKEPPGFLADGLQLIAGLDLRSDGEMDSPTHAGSTGVSLQRLSGQDGLMQAMDNTTSTAVAAETHILTRTRRPCFGLWSCWFVLASVVLAPLEVVATGRALAAAGHRATWA